jgi:hypothetical protein
VPVGGRDALQAPVDLLAPESRPTNTAGPSLVIPQATSTGSARAPSCMRKWLPSKKRYSSGAAPRRAAVGHLTLQALQVVSY